MNKIFSLFLLLIFVSGCIPSLEESEMMVREGVYKLKEELQKGLGIDEYAMRVGDEITVDNKLVRLESFDPDYVVVFDVDGAKLELRETKDPQIINDLELTLVPPFRYEISDVENNYVKVKILRFVPELDHYLFYLEDTKQVLGHEIKLTKIEKTGSVTISIDVTNDLRIMEDKTEGIANLYIGNVRPVYRAIASERHAILKIVEKP